MLLDRIAALAVIRIHANAAKMQRHRAHVTRDSHFVVVQDDDERRLFLPDIVQGLERASPQAIESESDACPEG